MHDRHAAVIPCPIRKLGAPLKLAWIDRLPGAMPDVENDQLVAGRRVKYPIGVVSQRDDPDDSPLLEYAATRRELRNELDDDANSLLDGGGRAWVALSEVTSNFRQIGYSPRAVCDPHLRKRAKASST